MSASCLHTPRICSQTSTETWVSTVARHVASEWTWARSSPLSSHHCGCCALLGLSLLSLSGTYEKLYVVNYVSSFVNVSKSNFYFSFEFIWTFFPSLQKGTYNIYYCISTLYAVWHIYPIGAIVYVSKQALKRAATILDNKITFISHPIQQYFLLRSILLGAMLLQVQNYWKCWLKSAGKRKVRTEWWTGHQTHFNTFSVN